MATATQRHPRPHRLDVSPGAKKRGAVGTCAHCLKIGPDTDVSVRVEAYGELGNRATQATSVKESTP